MVTENSLLKNGYEKYLNGQVNKHTYSYQKKIKNYFINIQYWSYTEYADLLNRTLEPAYNAEVQFNTNKGITFNVELLDVTKMSVTAIEDFFNKIYETELVSDDGY